MNKEEKDHLFGVEFYLGRDNNSRYCEIVAKPSDDLFEILMDIYDDMMLISEVDDKGECNEDGEIIGD